MENSVKLKNFREKEGISQQTLADKLGITQTQVSMIEKGARDVSAGFKLAFLKTYGIDFDTNINEEGTITKQETQSKRRIKDFSFAIKTIGKRITAIQVANNLNNNEMAQILDMSERRYEKIITGKEKPYFDEIISIAENFDISLDEVILDINTYKNQAQSPEISEKELEMLNTFKALKDKGLI